MPQNFTVIAQDPSTRARAGILRTAHGHVETPVFMPVATQASVKALSQEDLAELNVQAILANSYHLYLRPGTDIIEAAGGLHRFMNYQKTILTDSGGFQIFSLSALRSLQEDGVIFQSHHDGSRHTLTPQGVIRLQARLGSDIWTSLDECPPYPCSGSQAEQALRRTLRWSEISHQTVTEEREKREIQALFFPILQGSVYPELRRQAVEHLQKLRWDGVALGGFSVGEPKELTWSVLEQSTENLPPHKPRYLMGLGAPEDLWEAVRLGVDMMDSVWPTRIARNGCVMLRQGRFNIKNAPFRRDFSPLDPNCACSTCLRYSRAYLSHLFRAKELTAHRLLTLHNLYFTLDIMRQIRESIRAGRFESARREFSDTYRQLSLA